MKKNNGHIVRVFPRRTRATPVDDYAFVGDPPLVLSEDITEVHVSVAFTWDLPEAERLARVWSKVAPVKIGGPATGQRGEDFTPGVYLKPGYVITSRGCDNNCWFCSVPTREGAHRELPITEGWNVLDDNLLAASEKHFDKVIQMLHLQEERALFTGGLEAARLTPHHVDAFKRLRPKRVYFAYDTPGDKEPLLNAVNLFRTAEYGSRNILYCYVLIGYPGDTFSAAEERLRFVMDAGMCPMAMLYRDPHSNTPPLRGWGAFQRAWARPSAIYSLRRDHSYLKEDRHHD